MQGEKKQVALVTGSSSGIGFETALIFARNGFSTYASMRNIGKSKSITEIANKEDLPLQVIQLDVNDESSVNVAINKIITEKGSIDVLVNNAGYGLFAPIEDVTLDQVKDQFETNFFGIVRLIKEVLPVMRKKGQGIIVNVSSIGGRVVTPLNSAYVASKFALEGLSESLRHELNGFGIKLILIEPGVIKTSFVENLKTAESRSEYKSPYSDLVLRIMKGFEVFLEDSSHPKLVAEAIVKAATSKEPAIRYIVGEDAESIMKVRKSTSDKEFENWMYESFLEGKGFVRERASASRFTRDPMIE